MKLLMVLGDDISTEKAYMPSFIKSLDREKNIVKIVLKNDPELVRFICDMGFEVITVEHGRSVFTHGVVRELETIFEDEIPDAIHVFSEFWARTAAKAAYDMEVKIFATCQNSKEAMSVAKIKNISKIIVHSLAEKSELASKNIQNEKLAVIPQSAEPIDPISEKEKDRNREELGIEKTDIVFSVFARLEEQGEHEIFLKAACEALKTHPELKFLIVGGGSLKESLAALAVDLKIEDNVIFAPPCRDITGYLNLTDINVILSKYGGKSAVLRSMSLNLPSIVSDDMLSLEIVEDGVNGLVFERGNSETLYTAMITLAENSELTDRLGDISGKMFDNKFSALRVAKAYEDLYANVFS